MFEKIYMCNKTNFNDNCNVWKDICVTKQTLTITAMFGKIYTCNKTNFNNNCNVWKDIYV